MNSNINIIFCENCNNREYAIEYDPEQYKFCTECGAKLPVLTWVYDNRKPNIELPKFEIKDDDLLAKSLFEKAKEEVASLIDGDIGNDELIKLIRKKAADSIDNDFARIYDKDVVLYYDIHSNGNSEYEDVKIYNTYIVKNFNYINCILLNGLFEDNHLYWRSEELNTPIKLIIYQEDLDKYDWDSISNYYERSLIGNILAKINITTQNDEINNEVIYFYDIITGDIIKKTYFSFVEFEDGYPWSHDFAANYSFYKGEEKLDYEYVCEINPETCEHEFEVSNEMTGITEYTCKKCGFTKTEAVLPPAKELDNDRTEELITSDEDAESQLYSKSIIFLEAAIATLVESDFNDNGSKSVILASLCEAPLYFPVEIDVQRAFGIKDPSQIKKGDVLTPQSDLHFKLLTIGSGDEEIVPMFTSEDEARKGPAASTIRLFPKEYLPMLIDNRMNAIINPFSKYHLILPKDIYENILYLANKSTDDKEKDTATESKTNRANQEEFIGKTIEDNYVIIKHIGRGGLSEVYLANDTSTGNKVAIKIISKYLSGAHDAAIRDSLIRENTLLTTLNHPSIPKFYETIEDDEYFFEIREYFEGFTLDKLLKDLGPRPAEKVAEWGIQICDILSYLHGHNPPVIHRDIKPSNIIATTSGELKIFDFGIARTYKKGQDRDEILLGTKGYAPPEQFGSGQTDARSDIYSLGITMQELLTGIDPKASDYVFQPARNNNSEIPKELEKIIVKCVQTNPDKRYQSCQALKKDLTSFLNPDAHKGLFAKLFK